MGDSHQPHHADFIRRDAGLGHGPAGRLSESLIPIIRILLDPAGWG
jgi:hypothetical protein